MVEYLWRWLLEKMENLIYGMLLGDSSISIDKVTPYLTVSHSVAQLQYVKWKAHKLGFKGKIRDYTSGYGSKMRGFRYFNHKILHQIRANCVRNGHKTVTKEWIQKLDTLSLAVWFQDDGSWGKSGKRTKVGGRTQRYSQFHTQGFDLESIHLLVEWLKSKGYDPRIKSHKQKYKIIQLNHSDTLRLWQEISPYIILIHKIDNLRGNVDNCKCGQTKSIRNNICDKCLYKIATTSNLPRRSNDGIIRAIHKRFGTYSVQLLRKKPPVLHYPTKYRIDPKIIGSKAYS